MYTASYWIIGGFSSWISVSTTLTFQEFPRPLAPPSPSQIPTWPRPAHQTPSTGSPSWRGLQILYQTCLILLSSLQPSLSLWRSSWPAASPAENAGREEKEPCLRTPRRTGTSATSWAAARTASSPSTRRRGTDSSGTTQTQRLKNSLFPPYMLDLINIVISRTNRSCYEILTSLTPSCWSPLKPIITVLFLSILPAVSKASQEKPNKRHFVPKIIRHFDKPIQTSKFFLSPQSLIS